MKQTRTQNLSTKTQTGSAPAIRAAAPPVRHLKTSGGGRWPKAGVIALLLGTGLLTAMGQTNQPQYKFIEIPLPSPAEALGISDSGLVTGAYVNPVTGGWTSFVLKRGDLSTGIEIPGATDTILGPANIWGVESGNYGNETNQRPVFRDIRRGTFTPLPEIPGMPFNEDNGINDFGHGVGVAYASGDINVGGNGVGMNWFWDGRDYSFFTVPGSEVNGASVGGLNDWDQISGYYVDSTGTPHGFVKNGTNYTTLDVPGAIFTLANAINNRGEVPGLYLDASGYHGFLWSHGEYFTVDTDIAGADGVEWFGINDNGDLAGFTELTTDAGLVQTAVIALRVDEDGQK